MHRRGIKPLPLALKPCDGNDLCDGDRIAIQGVLEVLDKLPTIQKERKELGFSNMLGYT